MPRPGGLASLGPASPEIVAELPPIPPGHVPVPGTPPGHEVFVPPELANNQDFLQNLLRSLPALAPAWRPQGGLRAFFNGAQPNVNDLRGAEAFPVSPGRDWYEVVRNQEEADQVLEEGAAPPLIWRWPTAPSFTDLRAQQEGQYASPGGSPLFAADAAGQLYRAGDADTRPWDAGGLASLGRTSGGRR